MSDDSADVWVHPELFKLNGHKHPGFVGVCRLIISAKLGSDGETLCTTGVK